MRDPESYPGNPPALSSEPPDRERFLRELWKNVLTAFGEKSVLKTKFGQLKIRTGDGGLREVPIPIVVEVFNHDAAAANQALKVYGEAIGALSGVTVPSDKSTVGSRINMSDEDINAFLEKELATRGPRR